MEEDAVSGPHVLQTKRLSFKMCFFYPYQPLYWITRYYRTVLNLLYFFYGLFNATAFPWVRIVQLLSVDPYKLWILSRKTNNLARFPVF